MARVKNIEDYRKKRRKKVLLRRVLFFSFIIFIVLGGWMIYRSYQNSIVDQGVAEQKNTSFPVSLKGDAIKGFTMCGSNVALLTDKEYMLYSAKGRTLQTVQHGYFNPSIKSSSKRILIYDISGTKFMVANKSGTIFDLSTEQKILFGEIADNGNIAIITQDDRYQCRLTVYDSTGQEVYKWYSAEALVTSLDFTGSGKGCVLTAVNTKSGIMQSELIKLDFDKEQEIFKQTMEQGMAVSVVVKSSGKIQMVTDTAVVTLDGNGSQISSYDFSKDLKYYVNTSGYTVVLQGEEVKDNQKLTVLDSNGGTVAETTINDQIRDLDTDGNYVYLLTNQQVQKYNMKLELKGSIEDQAVVSRIIGKNNTVYGVSTSKLECSSL